MLFSNGRYKEFGNSRDERGHYSAWLGDSLLRLDISQLIGHVDEGERQAMTSAKRQRFYLEEFAWDVALKHGLDKTRSDHSFAEAFEEEYWERPQFRLDYLSYSYPGHSLAPLNQ